MKKRKLTNNLTLISNNNYPICINKIDNKKYTFILGIGGNLGNVLKIFDSLLKCFKNDTKLKLKETSPILKNPPFGYLEQEYFFNAIIKIKTDMTPLYLLNVMQKYEHKFGRKRSFKDAPRTLDIDIIFIQRNSINMKINTKFLNIPHIGWKTRDSVKIPLQYIKNNKCKAYNNDRN
jgi:2-amino-4-hydroxy-6-hydroxymethyldihydropteridine diphosphokinase